MLRHVREGREANTSNFCWEANDPGGQEQQEDEESNHGRGYEVDSFVCWEVVLVGDNDYTRRRCPSVSIKKGKEKVSASETEVPDGLMCLVGVCTCFVLSMYYPTGS